MQEDEKIEEYVILEGKEERSWKEKLANFLNGRYFIPVVIVLIATISFSLGRISGLQNKRPPVKIISESSGPARLDGMSGGEVKGVSTDSVSSSAMEVSSSVDFINSSQTSSGQARPPTLEAVGDSGRVVASKNGTKYHYPWCAGAKQISEKNLITFESIESARTAGYTPASNCKGLK